MEVNKIYNESNLETMSRMPDNFIDLTVTSPPYDNLRTYNGYSFPFEEIAAELFRVTKSGGVVVWVVGDATIKGSETGTSFKQALFFISCGFRLHDTMIYQKKNFIPQNNDRYEQEFEYMFILSKGKVKTFNPIMESSIYGGKAFNYSRKGYGFKEGSFRRRNEVVVTNDLKVRGNIFDYPVGNSGVNHPAVFPEELARDQIFTWSNEGDLIYDCFMGSGTTAKQAHLQKRNWIGSEISAEYVSVAEERLRPIISQMNLFQAAS